MVTLAEILATGLPLDDHGAIATELSKDRTTIRATQIGIGTVLAVMAPKGGLFMRALRNLGNTEPPTEATANVFETVKMIEQGTLDVGHPVTREQLQDFANDNPGMAANIEALLAIAVVDDPVSSQEVTKMLEGV